MKTNVISFPIILLLMVLLLTCQKDESVPLNQFSITNEDVQTTATTAKFEVRYVYRNARTQVEGKMKYVKILYSKEKEMAQASQQEANQESDMYGTYFKATLSNLEALTTYYYCYEVANEVDVMKTEVKSFKTSEYGLPTLTSVNVSNITGVGFTLSCNVTDGGETQVLERGFCYSITNSSPDINGQHVAAGSGLGSFTAGLTGLTPSTTYYVRAYAKNAYGISYSGMKVVNTTTGVPVVVTGDVSSITSNTALCAANVTSDGGFPLTVKGVCWSTSPNPTVNNSHTSNGTATGAYSGYMTGLTASTTYYVRAYATNSNGTSYGTQKTFTTQGQCPNTVSDYDGNTYATVMIGTQCWMNQNLRTTHYANGQSISLSTSSTSTSTAYRYYPDNNSSNVSTYGYLYNWPAVMHGAGSSNSNPSGVQGICPNGWHLPSHAEYVQLLNYLGGQTQYQCNGNSANIAKALASTTGWESSSTTCHVGNNPSSNNASGFSAPPAGEYFVGIDDHDYDGNKGISLHAYFWTSWEYTIENTAIIIGLLYNGEDVKAYYNLKAGSVSVRCVHN